MTPLKLRKLPRKPLHQLWSEQGQRWQNRAILLLQKGLVDQSIDLVIRAAECELEARKELKRLNHVGEAAKQRLLTLSKKGVK